MIDELDRQTFYSWPTLLRQAEKLHQDNHNGPAVVTAQSACEVVVSKSMTLAYDKAAVPVEQRTEMQELTSMSLSGAKVRGLYNRLTGDDVAVGAYWTGYKKMVELRNSVVHEGGLPGKPETRDALDAAKAFVAHVVQHNKLED